MYARTAHPVPLPSGVSAPGFYLVGRPKTDGVFTHVGILTIDHSWVPYPATVTHLEPSGLRTDVFDPRHGWVIGERIADQIGAQQRLQMPVDRTYDAVSNNCEHFVQYIAQGTKESVQLQRVGWAAAVLIGFVAFTKR